MKTRRFIFIMLALLAVQVSLFAQDRKMTRKEKEAAWRAERLRKRAQEERQVMHDDSIQFVQAVNAIRSGSWALEASNVTFNNGVTRFVTASTNFVSVDDGQAVVQTAFNNSNVNSPNGLGGITLEGRITSEEMKMDKDGNVYYNYGIQGADISATVNIVVTANSNQATATVNPNFSSNQMTFSGYIYPYDTAGVIEGNPGYY